MELIETIPARCRPASARGLRARIEAAIETLLIELDRMDGDPDLENLGVEDDFIIPAWLAPEGAGCPLADPGGETERAPLLPVYGIDQSKGPLNENAGYRAWQEQFSRPTTRQ